MKRWIVPATAVVAHGSALRAGYVWLDHAHLEAKAAIAPPSGWLGLFTHGFAGTGYYRPLTALSLSVDALVDSPVLYHAVNLVWHAAVAMMVTLVAEMFGRSRRAAIVAGVLFAVHPLGSLVASAIAFRSESMLATFLLLLVWAHRKHKPALAAGALLAAALTKETGLVLAPLFVAAVATKDDLKRPRRPLVAVEAIAFIAALALRSAFAPAWRASHEPLGIGAAVGTRLGSLTKSALALVLPFDRTICDAFRVLPWTSPAALVGAFLAGFVIVIAVRRRGPALLFALSLLPSLQLVPVMRWWSPHYVYLALAFVAILASESVDRLRTSVRSAFIMVGVALAILGAVSFLEDRRFASDATLWRKEVAAQPACLEAHFYLGDVARESRNWALAESHYQAALEPRRDVLAYVDRRSALQNLGTVRLEQRRFEEAKDAFRGALAITRTTDPYARRQLIHDLAVATFRADDAAAAERLLEEETARPDALPASLIVRAMALERLGRDAEAKALRARLP
jgi:protein O-mannosyl-transferase